MHARTFSIFTFTRRQGSTLRMLHFYPFFRLPILLYRSPWFAYAADRALHLPLHISTSFLRIASFLLFFTHCAFAAPFLFIPYQHRCAPLPPCLHFSFTAFCCTPSCAGAANNISSRLCIAGTLRYRDRNSTRRIAPPLHSTLTFPFWLYDSPWLSWVLSPCAFSRHLPRISAYSHHRAALFITPALRRARKPKLAAASISFLAARTARHNVATNCLYGQTASNPR